MSTEPTSSAAGERVGVAAAAAGGGGGGQRGQLDQVGRGATGGSARQQAQRVRLVIKSLLVVNRSGWLIAGFVAALFVGGILDYVFRAPGWVRGGGLVVAAAVVGSLLVRRLLPALRFHPSVEDIALRMATPARRYDIPAAVGLAGQERGGGSGLGGITSGLAMLAGQQSGGAVAGQGLIRWQPAARAAGALALACLLVFAMFAAQPALAWIGSRRMLLPWTEAQWPRRYHVEAIGGTGVSPLGRAVLLQAGLVQAPGKLAGAEVRAVVSVSVPGADGKPERTGPERTVVLTAQDRTKPLSYTSELGEQTTAEAMVFERLLEPGALELRDLVGDRPVEAVTLRYRLVAGDHTTAEQTLKLVRPPAVEGVAVSVQPPAYLRTAVGAAGSGAGAGGGPERRELGKPAATVVVPAVAEGSAVTVELKLSRALAAPADVAAALGPQVAGLVASGGATLGAQGDVWTVRTVLRESLAMPIRLTDENGLRSADDVGLRLEAKPDRLPEPVVTEPATDQLVTPNASVDVAVEARDDLGLVALAAVAQRASRPNGSVGGVPEPSAGKVVLSQATISTPVASERVTATVVPSKLGAQPGDELLLTAVAQDNFELEGKRHDPVTSAPRKLRVVSAEQLTEKLISDLAALRRGVIATTERQDALRKATARAAEQAETAAKADAAAMASDEPAAAKQAARQAAQQSGKEANAAMRQAAREQAELSRQIERLAEQAAAAAKTSQQNKLDPGAAERAAQAAADALKQAKEASSQAGGKAEQAAKAGEQGQEGQAGQQGQDGQQGKSGEAGEQGREGQQAKDAAQEAAKQAAGEARKEQEAAAKALSQAAAALDRGQDAWAAKRMLQELAEGQKQVREATAKAGREAAGKSPEQLNDQQRDALRQAADQQEELARRAGELEQKLKQQAEAVKQRDPGAADALDDAAKRARQADVAQKMRDAAEQVRKNQAGEAQQGQQKAEQTLRSMLEQIENAKARSDAVLRRQLDSLAQSIDVLIAQQQGELKRLGESAATGRFDGLDQGMIRLHGGTLAALDKAQAAENGKKAAELLKAAADNQVAAIGDLRARPIRPDDARRSEDQSLKSLQEAKAATEEAQKEAAEREAAERRAALRAAYESILEDQKAVTADTQPLIGKPADRRAQQTARDIAARQALIPGRIDDLKDKLTELAESGVFEIANERIKSAANSASTLLKGTKWTTQLAGRQAAVERTLQALIDALKEKNDADKDFRENEQGEQQGGQGQGGQQQQKEPLLPPVTELEILKGMQREAMIATREASEAGDKAAAKAAADEAAGLQQKLTDRARQLIEKINKQQGQ